MATFEFIQESPVSGVGFVYKSATEAFYYDGTTVTPIRTAPASFDATTGSGTATLNISSVTLGNVFVGMTLTGLSGAATITALGTFNGTSGTVTISPATRTWSNPTTVTASGTVANYPAITVRGIVYLDGTYYVMTPQGSIYGSAIDDPLTWTALNVIQSQGEPDGGIALARQLNLIVSFGAYSTEFFYDANNPPPGSPLLPYSSAMLEVGCAVAESVTLADNSIFFLGVSRQKGRGLYSLTGTTPQYLSNPFIDRIFNKDDLVAVSSFCVRIGGHLFYIIYLGTSQVTLVYDVTSTEWATWTATTVSSTIVPSSLSWSNGVARATRTGHGFADGDYVTSYGNNPSGYDGSYVVNVPDLNHFTFPVASNPGSFVSAGRYSNYVEGPFAIASYTSGNNLDIIQDSTTGWIYLLDAGTYTDNGKPIEVLARTFKFDAGDNKKKFISKLEIIGDKVASTAYVRYTNDDYQTWSQYRPVDLNAQRSLLNRLGQASRKAFEVRHHDNVPLRLEALELTPVEGNR
jgi:hypothetical protein